MATEDTPEILIIDDYATDAGLARRAIEESGVACRVNVMDEARAAMRYLNAAAQENRLPRLILLDYRMPMNGGHTISEIRNDATLSHLPILVLTAAVSADDIYAVYRLGANACYTKPFDFSGYAKLFHAVLPHWLRVAALPRCAPR